ncbi:DUF5677 domain-containing protein [Cupriavidus basilensis]
MATRNDISAKGFLSPEIDAYRARYRRELATSFAACEAESDRATARLFAADLSSLGDGEMLALAFWCRCVSACQGTILLVERGMVPEGLTLLRSAFEFLFYGLASMEDPAVFASLAGGHDYARSEQAKAMKREGAADGHLSEAQLADLQSIVDEIHKPKPAISVFDAARKAGLSYFHASVYRGLSMIGSHATMAATDSAFEATDAGLAQMVFGPSMRSAEFCLGLVETCLRTGSPRFAALLPVEST